MPHADLNVTQPKFLQQFEKELKTTPIAQWRTYLEWQVLNASADALSAPFVDENFEFNNTLTGAKEMKPRWKRCAEATDNQLGEALGKKYVEKYFPPEAKARMQAMVKNILLAMDDTIRDLDWMSDATKKKALEKLADVQRRRSAIPTNGRTTRAWRSSRDSYWDDIVAASRWNADDGRKQIGKPVDRGRWGMTPPTSNAYYNPLLNEIVFPAGILQPPAFDVNATDAVNYGAIGVVIGHEISHGFDDQGAQFDAKGALEQLVDRSGQRRNSRRARSASSISSTATSSSRASTTTASSCSANRSAISAAPSSRTSPTRNRAKTRRRSRPSTASRPSSSSSSPGANGAATRSARRRSARWCRAIRTRSRSTA